jgi:small subunit ribosomal protein S6
MERIEREGLWLLKSYQPKGEKMRLYETIFMARQDITPAQVDTLAKKYIEVIEKYGGSVSKTELCGLRDLAYPINKNSKAHYVLMNITSVSEGIKEVERQMKLNEDILRYLTVRVETHNNAPSPLMQQRHFEDRYKSPQDDEFSHEDMDIEEDKIEGV